VKAAAPLLFLAALGSLAFAVDYRLAAEGGPGDLAERVAEAFATWAEVEGAEVDAQVTEDADNLIRYGDGAAFGPDTLSLTVQRTPQNTTEVLLNPTEVSERALLHETGLLLGLPPAPGTRSVMNPAIPEGAEAALTPADESAIREENAFAAEDINQDGTVDFYDLAELGAAFGQTGVNLPADITGDGTVNRADLERLRAVYVFGAPSEAAPSGITGAVTGGGMTGGALTGGAMTGGAAPVEGPGGMTGGAGEPPLDAQTGGGF